MEDRAEDLAEAIRKAAVNTPANICLTSLAGAEKFRLLHQEQMVAQQGRYVGSDLIYHGMKVRGAAEIESEHAFFLKGEADTAEFLESVREFKAAGGTWDQFVAATIARLGR